METEIKFIKRGRPPIYTNFDRKEYNKQYYEMNKEKHKGFIICQVCHVYCSKSNKTRHCNSKLHINNMLYCDKDFQEFVEAT